MSSWQRSSADDESLPPRKRSEQPPLQHWLHRPQLGLTGTDHDLLKPGMTSRTPDPQSPLVTAAESDDDRGQPGKLPLLKSPDKPGEPAPLDRLFSERVVEVLVGPVEIKWCIHENLLSSSSDFFKSAFNSGFREAADNKITLPEDDPLAFELFVRYLYTKTLTPDTGGINGLVAPAGPNERGRTGPSIQDYLKLYVLASKFLVEDLENACVDITHAFYKIGTRRPDIKDVSYIYENTMPGCGMRKLLKEMLTLGLFRGKQNNPMTAEWRDVLNGTEDLGFDILVEIGSYNWITGGNAPSRAVTGEACAFHRHERSEACKR